MAKDAFNKKNDLLTRKWAQRLRRDTSPLSNEAGFFPNICKKEGNVEVTEGLLFTVFRRIWYIYLESTYPVFDLYILKWNFKFFFIISGRVSKPSKYAYPLKKCASPCFRIDILFSDTSCYLFYGAACIMINIGWWLMERGLSVSDCIWSVA